MLEQLIAFKRHLHVSGDLAKATDRTPVQQTLALADEHHQLTAPKPDIVRNSRRVERISSD